MRISCFLVPVGAQTGLGHVHQLGARLGVLDLGHVDIARIDAGLLEGITGGVHGRTIRALGRQRRAEHLERAVVRGCA